MLFIRVVAVCLLALFAATGTLRAKGRIFLFPPSGTDVITVLDADTLAAIGSFTGTSTVTDVVGTADGKKFYAISRTSTDTVVVVDSRDPAGYSATQSRLERFRRRDHSRWNIPARSERRLARDTNRHR